MQQIPATQFGQQVLERIKAASNKTDSYDVVRSCAELIASDILKGRFPEIDSCRLRDRRGAESSFGDRRTETRDISIDDVTGISQGYLENDTTWHEVFTNLCGVRMIGVIEWFLIEDSFLTRNNQDITFAYLDGQLSVHQGKHRVLVSRYLAEYFPERFSNKRLLNDVTVFFEGENQ